MNKFITESYKQFLLEKNIDIITIILNSFKEAGFPAEIDDTIKQEINKNKMNGTVDLIVQFKNKEDYISTSTISGVVYLVGFKKNIKLGEITDQDGLVKGIKSTFKKK